MTRLALILLALLASPAWAGDRPFPFKFEGRSYHLVFGDGGMAKGHIYITDSAGRLVKDLLPAGACVNCPIERSGR